MSSGQMKKFRPLLAADAKESDVVFPCMVSPKIDGIRCLIINGKAVSRSLKPIPNHFIRNTLERDSRHINHFDGELTVGDGFNSSTSGIMSHEGEPKFTYHVFDHLLFQTEVYEKRNARLVWATENRPAYVNKLRQTVVYNVDELQDFYKLCLEQGHEGVIVRDPLGVYKHGRSTLKQRIMLKLKPFADSEARIVGFKELMHNDNEQSQNELGLSKRSSKKEGKRGAGTLGKFVVVGMEEGHFKNVEFKIGAGKGLTRSLRDQVWESPQSFMGRVIKFKYQEIGSIDKPRIPIFLGFRDKRDM